MFLKRHILVVQHPTNAINCYRCELGTDGCGAQSFNRDGSGVFTTDDSSATYCMVSFIVHQLTFFLLLLITENGLFE